MKKINSNFIRSFLFTPAIKDGFYEKILSLEGNNKPDAIIFDLEDSVAEDKKTEARNILLEKLLHDQNFRDQMFDKYIILIRINKYGTKWFNDDVAAIKKIRPHFIRLAKVESGKEIEIVRKAVKNLPVAACIESLEGFANIDRIFQSLKPGDIFNLGYEDLSAELLIERPDRLDMPNPLTTIINQSIIFARKYKITMIDSVSRKFKSPKNLKELRTECSFTRTLGLTGKTAIHPSQIPVINKAFDRTEEIAAAQDSLDQFKNLSDGTLVIVDKNYHMKDTPSLKMYTNIINSLN